MAAAMGFPMGVRFRPTDVEKMNILLCKVTGLALPCGDFMIGTADLYGQKEPWQILRDSEGGEQCFFTMLKKIGKNGKRFSRHVGNGGTWSNKGQTAPIFGGKGQLLGYKRCFRYENKQVDHDDVGTWLLKEYTLPDHTKVKQEYKDCALCVLKRKGGGGKTTEESSGFDNNNYFMSLLLGSGSEIPGQQQQESNYYHHANSCGLMSEFVGQEEEEEESNLSGGLSDFAEQFLREERQS